MIDRNKELVYDFQWGFFFFVKNEAKYRAKEKRDLDQFAYYYIDFFWVSLKAEVCS